MPLAIRSRNESTPSLRRQVEDYIALLLAAQLEMDFDQAQDDDDAQDDDKPRGYVEIKIIKGNQYAYRRWRADGKLKSKYIGKVKES